MYNQALRPRRRNRRGCLIWWLTLFVGAIVGAGAGWIVGHSSLSTVLVGALVGAGAAILLLLAGLLLFALLVGLVTSPAIRRGCLVAFVFNIIAAIVGALVGLIGGRGQPQYATYGPLLFAFAGAGVFLFLSALLTLMILITPRRRRSEAIAEAAGEGIVEMIFEAISGLFGG